LVVNSQAFRVERRSHSSRELQNIMDGVTFTTFTVAPYMTYIDAERNQVMVGMRSLSHGLLAEVVDHYGDAATVQLDPFAPEMYLDERPANPPSWWELAQPPATWFTLTTGFPLYLGLGLLLILAGWLVPILRRQARSRVATGSEPDSGPAVTAE
jgi:hypothetical protein